MNILTIDIGGTTIKIATTDPKGNINNLMTIPTESERGGKHVINNLITHLKSTSLSFNKIGVSTVGFIDEERGSILYANKISQITPGAASKINYKRYFVFL